MTEENKVVALSEYIEEFMLEPDKWSVKSVHAKAITRLQEALQLLVDELYDIKYELTEDNLELAQIIGIADDYRSLAQEFSAYWYLLSGEDLDESFITKLLFTEPKPELTVARDYWDTVSCYDTRYVPRNELTIDNSHIDFTAAPQTLTINTDQAGFDKIIINVSK